MPHQCTKCHAIYPDAAGELLQGCSCGSKFFYYIREQKARELQQMVSQLRKSDSEQLEKDIREMTGIHKPDEVVILDLEAVNILEPGKFEIDVANLLDRDRPVIYKLAEGKYIVDISSTLGGDRKDVKKAMEEYGVGRDESEIEE